VVRNLKQHDERGQITNIQRAPRCEKEGNEPGPDVKTRETSQGQMWKRWKRARARCDKGGNKSGPDLEKEGNEPGPDVKKKKRSQGPMRKKREKSQ
jgi:hypothetical protein